LITGGAKRIGRALARTLAREGVHVVVHYHASAGEAEALREELLDLGVQAWTVPADFTHPEDYDTLIERAASLAGQLDILVNNASIFPQETMEEATLASLCTNIEVNAWVPFALMRAFARRVARGKIINLLDSRLHGYDWQHAGYIWSKHVLDAMTRMAALQYAPQITVNAVAPGFIPTYLTESLPQELKDGMMKLIPLGRWGKPEEIAYAVAFLASDEAAYITGQVLSVDGGMMMM